MDMEKKRWGDEEEDLSLLLLHKEFGCLIQKILVWLPVVSLLRFKAVCKSWRDLIQSPFFIDLHTPITLTSSSSSSKFGSFIVQVWRYFPPPDDSESEKSPSNEYTLLMLSSPSYDDSESEEEEEEEEEKEEEESVSISGGGSNDDDDQEGPVVVVDDLGFDRDVKEIVGSCNGLVCLRDDRKKKLLQRGGPKPLEVFLWNPATGKCSVLPESKTIPGDISSLFVFGFDVETKDYKVVQFTALKPRWNGNGPEFCFCRVQVYSLSTDSWRLLEGITCLPGYPFEYPYPESVVYLNGTCFFLAHFFYTRCHPCLPRNDRLIISFDFTKEIVTPIQLPDHHRDQDMCLCSLGDKIALFTSTIPFEARIQIFQDFNIWVLNYEQGSSSSSSVNKESWKELYSFQLQLESPDKCYTPSGISNDGKFALLTSEYGNKMNLYNFATKKVKRNFLSCRKVMSKAHAYKPSLVSVIGGNGAGEMVQGAAAAADDDMVIENSATNL